MQPIKQGGFMYHPANLRHDDGSNDGEEVIVQIMGMGPVKAVQRKSMRVVSRSSNPAARPR